MNPSILQICSVQFTFTRFLAPLCESLVSRNWRVSASFLPDDGSPISPRLNSSNIQYIPSKFYRSAKFTDIYSSWRSLDKLLRASNSRIVHVHTPLLSYLVRIYFSLPFLRHYRKLIYTVHGFYFHPYGNPFTNTLHFLIELLLLPACDMVFFVSRQDFNLASPYLRFLQIKHTYIGNGVCTQLFSPGCSTLARSQTSISTTMKHGQRFVIGYVGRLVPEKGLLDLFAAFKLFHSLFPDSVLLLVGSRLDSDYDKSLDTALQDILTAFPQSVVCTGMIDDTETLVNHYRSMNIFCLPSYREGLPTSLIEAMSCGIPSVATNIRGSAQLITHELTGLLVPPKSPMELFSSFCRLRSEPELMSKLSFQARLLVRQEYDLASILDKQCDDISLL